MYYRTRAGGSKRQAECDWSCGAHTIVCTGVSCTGFWFLANRQFLLNSCFERARYWRGGKPVHFME